jgi:hypothetical protein
VDTVDAPLVINEEGMGELEIPLESEVVIEVDAGLAEEVDGGGVDMGVLGIKLSVTVMLGLSMIPVVGPLEADKPLLTGVLASTGRALQASVVYKPFEFQRTPVRMTALPCLGIFGAL